jgi:hypothetical protein
VNEFPELRAALLDAAERQQHLVDLARSTGPGSPGRLTDRRSWRPLPLRTVAIAVAVLLVITAVALAAAGVFSAGRPVTPVSAPNPRAFDGAAIPSTVHVLALRVADPAGGAPWGLRVLNTTRGEICITPGRVQHGVIGVIGSDRAFGNDGRLHPFVPSYIGPVNCAIADARGHAFLTIGLVGLPSSALLPESAKSAGGCLLDNPPPANRALLCPTRALRDVYYGLLGPDAASLTYRNATGHQRTTPTSGPDGAYLIVLPYPGGLQGNASIGTGLSAAPFVSVHYRDGRTCSLAGGRTCQPVGYQPPQLSRLTVAGVRTPITIAVVHAHAYCSSDRTGIVIACDRRAPPGFSPITGGAPFVLVNIRFTARVPVTNSHSYYELDVSYPKSPGCTVGGTQGPTNTDIRAGQRIELQNFDPLSCPGPLRGTVTYVSSSSLGPAGTLQAPSRRALLIGRFDINPSQSSPASR